MSVGDKAMTYFIHTILLFLITSISYAATIEYYPSAQCDNAATVGAPCIVVRHDHRSDLFFLYGSFHTKNIVVTEGSTVAILLSDGSSRKLNHLKKNTEVSLIGDVITLYPCSIVDNTENYNVDGCY